MLTHFLLMLRQFNRDACLYLVASGLFGFTLFSGIFHVLLNLYLLRMGYGPQLVGLVSATGALSFAVASIPSGLLGMRWGSRLTMIIGICVAVVGFGLISQAELISPDRRQNFILATYSFGILGIALYIVNGTPFLMAITGPTERSHVFSVQAALSPLAGFAGSLFAGFLPGWLADHLNVSLEHPVVYRYTLFLGVVLLIPAIGTLVATRGDRPERRQESPTEAVPLPLGLIAITALISLFHTTGESAARTFFNVYLDEHLDVGVSLIGTLLAAAQLLAVPAALAMPFFSTRFGNRRMVVAGTAATALMLIPLALIPHWGAAGLAYMVIAALAALRRVAFAIFSLELVPARWRTAMSGATSMMSGLGYSATALAGGYIIPIAGYHTLFLTGALLTAIGSALFWVCFRGARGRSA